MFSLTLQADAAGLYLSAEVLCSTMVGCGTCRRAVYDETGSLADSEEDLMDGLDSLKRYFKGIFATVSEDEIKAFEVWWLFQYRGAKLLFAIVVPFY